MNQNSQKPLNRGVYSQPSQYVQGQNRSSGAELLEPKDDFLSMRNNYQNSPTNKAQYSHHSKHQENEQTLGNTNNGENTSPIKVHDQTNSSITKLQSSFENLKIGGGIRSQTYSPLNNSNLSSVKKSPLKKESTFDPGNIFYESPGNKRNPNLTSSSKNVMKKVFDTEYSLDSPSKKKVQERTQNEQMYQTFKQYDKAAQEELEKLNSNYLKNTDINYEFLERSQQLFANKLKANPKTENGNIDEIISESLEYLKHLNHHLRVGAILNIFDILLNDSSSVGPGNVAQITSTLLNVLPQYQQAGDFNLMLFSLESLYLIGPNTIIYNGLKPVLALVTDDRFPKIQVTAVKVLVNLDYPGLSALLDLANKDFNDLPLFILNSLAQVPEIQARVIVPSLLNDFNSNDTKKKYASLSALNRMLIMTKYGGGLPVLVNLLVEGSLDRQLIVSTILGCGYSGEQAILKILKTSSDAKLKQIICSCLPWRLSSFNKAKVEIKIVPYQVSQHYQYNPGTMCIYVGSLKPLAALEISDGPIPEITDVLEINSRDFLASLQRLLTIKYQEFAMKDQGGVKDFQEMQSYNDFNKLELNEYFKGEPEQPEDSAAISPNIIKILIQLYSDKNSGVRDSAINALGIIGPPESGEALDILIKALYDSESQIRATAAWAIGKIGEGAAHRAGKRLIELLKDSFWKVRTSACIALGYMGDNIDPSPYPILVKILKDGSINKVVVCETLVRLGVEGEQILLDILKQVPNTNYGLKSAIIQSLELSDVDKPTIDFVIEELFRNSGDQMIQVRKTCLITLEKLRSRANANNITYLKSRNILPLFYYFMQDPSNEIRDMALQSIYSFGPQGELMLIEGLAKDKNSTIRAECAKGLALFGPHTFRALIFGLRDAEETVRSATAVALKKNFTPEEVINVFKDKHHQKPAIICAIREILNLSQMYYYSKPTKEYLDEILKYFQNEINHSRSQIDPLTTSLSREKLDNSYQNEDNRGGQYGQYTQSYDKENNRPYYKKEEI